MNEPGNMENAEKRLLDRGIRPTPVRLLVAKVLSESKGPLSSLQIETELDTVDRSSITRTLALFTSSRLVHLIEDGTGSAKYEICPSACGHSSGDEHVHFHCRKCGRTICLSTTAIPPVRLPDGYTAEDARYLITGLCPACSNV